MVDWEQKTNHKRVPGMLPGDSEDEVIRGKEIIGYVRQRNSQKVGSFFGRKTVTG